MSECNGEQTNRRNNEPVSKICVYTNDNYLVDFTPPDDYATKLYKYISDRYTFITSDVPSP